jgi:hypothetical protein
MHNLARRFRERHSAIDWRSWKAYGRRHYCHQESAIEDMGQIMEKPSKYSQLAAKMIAITNRPIQVEAAAVAVAH